MLKPFFTQKPEKSVEGKLYSRNSQFVPGWTDFFLVPFKEIEVTSWLVSADDFSSRVARGANERVSAANE